MKILSLLAVLGVLLPAGSALAQASPGCPEATPRDRDRVEHLIEFPEAWVRSELGLDSATIEDLRVIDGPSNAATCNALLAAVQIYRSRLPAENNSGSSPAPTPDTRRPGVLSPTARLAYFRSGTLFFVAVSDPGRIQMDGLDAGVYIIGRDMRARVRVGM